MINHYEVRGGRPSWQRPDGVEILDRALALRPDDADLLVAKSDALAHAMQYKTAEDVLDEVLARDPSHFEARMRKEHWGEWSSVFTLPSWSGEATTLTPAMRGDLDQGRSVQVVRVGVRPALAVLRPVAAGDMAPGLSRESRAIWEPVWSQTPAGAILVHYLLVEDDPSSPYRAEAFLPLEKPEKAHRMNGYWLLEQLSRVDGCFVVLAEGDRVLYDRWLPFPEHVSAHLQAMRDKLGTTPVASGAAGMQQAVQWHMSSFDMDQVSFDRPLSGYAAGVEEAATPATPVAPVEPAPPAEPAAPAATPRPGHVPTADALLGDPALAPQARAILLLNLCQIAEAAAPDMLDTYWAQMEPVAGLLPKEYTDAYKELSAELSAGSNNEASGVIPQLLAEVAVAKASVSGNPTQVVNGLASVEARLGERKMPFGKKRVYAALGDAWLDMDRGQVIRLCGLTSQAGREQLIKRMHAQQALTQDEWRMLSGVLRPTQAAHLALEVLRSGQSGLHVPADLVPIVGTQLVAGLGVQPVTKNLKELLDAAERLASSLAAEHRCDEAWAEADKILTWVSTVPVQQLGNVFLRFSIIERILREAVVFGCLPEERFARRVCELPVHLQAFARAFYRAMVTGAGGVEAGYRRLEQELSPQALQAGKRKKWGPDPAKMADAGHRHAAETYYLVRVAQKGLAREALELADRLGDAERRAAIVRALLATGGKDAREMLSPEQFEEHSVERFLALGTAEKRGEHLARITDNGARTIPGCLWRNWDAAQAMPQVRKGLLSSEMVPRVENRQEYCAHNVALGIADIPQVGGVGFDEKLFPEFVRTDVDLKYPLLDAALLPALVAWSEQDWEPARNAMIHMWEAIKPDEMVLQDDTLRNAVLKRAFGVLVADPEVFGSYVLPWTHEELVVKGRQWTIGNRQYTLRLSDDALAALSVQGALVLAEVAPARRDRLVEIVLGLRGTSVSTVKTFAQVYMVGRPLQLMAPPVQIPTGLALAWQEGVVASVVNKMREQMLLSALEEAFSADTAVGV